MIPCKCTYCEEKLSDAVKLYEHLCEEHNISGDDALPMVENEIALWSEEQRKLRGLDDGKQVDKKKKEFEEYEKDYLKRMSTGYGS